MRIAIIQDTQGQWFVRRLEFSVHDGANDRMVYHCNEPLAGPYADVIDAAHWVVDNIEEDDGGDIISLSKSA